MAFGLCNAPATYARAMSLVLHGLNWNQALTFLDDMLALGKSFEGYLKTLRDIFIRFRAYQLKLKPKKCELFQKQVEFLGRNVGPGGLEIGTLDIQTVLDWPCPESVKDVEKFLGLVNYHRSFIKDYAKKAAPLYQITGKKCFVWDDEQECAFQTLEKVLTSPPILGFPNKTDPFILDTDASDVAIGGVLIQVQRGKEKVICYGSYSLSSEQRRYCTTHKELLAVVRITRQYRHYLLGQSFTIRMDHSSLTWLLNFKDPQGQIARWLEELSQYNMRIVRRPGKNHGNADALSRAVQEEDPCFSYRAGSALADLPCGGCPYCTKAHQNWRGFEESVNDVVGLSARIYSLSLPENNLQTFLDADISSTCEENPADTEDYSHAVFKNELKIIGKTSVNSVDAKTSTWDLATEKVKQCQAAEPDFEFLIAWFVHHAEPREGELFIANPAVKLYWINHTSFVFTKELMWQRNPKTGDMRLLVPAALRAEVLYACHNISLSGHQGIDRTISRVKSLYYWHGMTKDVKKYGLQQAQKTHENSKMGDVQISCRGTNGTGAFGFSGSPS